MTGVYFDASVIVSLFINDDLTDQAEAFVRGASPIPFISDFAAAEFASALGLRARASALTLDEAREAFAEFDAWRRSTESVETGTADVALAEAFLRRLDLNLRTPDALNIALARRAQAPLATFDRRMAESALRLGVELAPL